MSGPLEHERYKTSFFPEDNRPPAEIVKKHLAQENYLVAPEDVADSAYFKEVQETYLPNFIEAHGEPGQVPMNIATLMPVWLPSEAALPDVNNIAISMGGTNSVIQLLGLENGVESIHEAAILPTPTFFEQNSEVNIKELINPVVNECYRLMMRSELGPQSYMVVWAFPHQAIERPGDLPLATGLQMTKGQEKVAAMGKRIHEYFQTRFKQLAQEEVLKITAGDDRVAIAYFREQGEEVDETNLFEIKTKRHDHYLKLIKGVEFNCDNVGNDGPHAANYFQAKYGREYRRMMLVIAGTGFNIAWQGEYLMNADTGEVIRDKKGYPVRLNPDKEGDITVETEAGELKFSTTQDFDVEDVSLNIQTFWVNSEAARTEPTELTQHTHYDQVAADRAYDIENLGAAGVGWGNAFDQLIADKELFSPSLQRKITEARAAMLEHKRGIELRHHGLVVKIENIELTAYEVALLSNHSKCPDEMMDTILGKAKLDIRERRQIRAIADAVVEKSALRIAQQLAVVSLATGIGVEQVEETEDAIKAKDALAVEGSLWKIEGYKELVKAYWQAFVQDKLDENGLKELNVDLLWKEDYNATAVGPLYTKALQEAQKQEE